VRIGIALWPTGENAPARKSAADFVATGMEATLIEAFAKPTPRKSA
jgi:hypothetical protein